jgi:hypothetical protein
MDALGSNGVRQLVVTKPTLIAAARAIKKLSGVGPTGARPEFFTLFIDSRCAESAEAQAHLDALAAFMNNVWSPGLVPPLFRQLFQSARLVPVKKADGSLRPVGCMEGMTRFLNRAEVYELRDKVAKLLPPVQLAVAVKGGCETLGHLVEFMLATDDTKALLSADVENAFNSIDRHFVLGAARKWLPEAVQPLLRQYSECPRLYYPRAVGEIAVTGPSEVRWDFFLAERGVIQGDPMAPLLFALGLHHVQYLSDCMLHPADSDRLTHPPPPDAPIRGQMAAQPDVRDPTHMTQALREAVQLRIGTAFETTVDYHRANFADDANVIASVETALTVLAVDEIVSQRAGLRVNPRKCTLLTANTRTPATARAAIRADFPGQVIWLGVDDEPLPKEQQGVTVAGKPIGTSEYIQGVLMNKFNNKYNRTAGLLLAHPNLQEAQLLSRMCFSKQPYYFLRIISPEHTTEFAATFDHLIFSLQRRLAGITAGDLVQYSKLRDDIIFTPLNKGGLGYTQLVDLAPLAYMASWCSLARLPTAAWFPQLHHYILCTDLRQASNRGPTAPAPLRAISTSLDALQRKLQLSTGDLMSTWSDLTNQPTPVTIRTLAKVSQRAATQAMFDDVCSRRTEELRATYTDKDKTAQQQDDASWISLVRFGNSAPSASDTLKCLPFTQACRVTNDVMRESLRMRCGLPFTFASLLRDVCDCKRGIGHELPAPHANGYHLLACQKGSQFHAAHWRMRAVLTGWVQRELPHLRVRIEPCLGGAQDRGDVAIDNLETTSKPTIILDFTTVHNYAPSFRTRARTGPLRIAAIREQEKHARYGEHVPPDATLVPFVIEMAGGLGMQAASFLDVLRRELQHHGHSAINAARRVQHLQFEFVTQHRKSYLSSVITRSLGLRRRQPQSSEPHE